MNGELSVGDSFCLDGFLKDKRLIILLTSNNEPRFNLMLEDLILKKVGDMDGYNVFRFWVNSECLVVGRTRHPSYGWYREDLAEKMNIRVFKRSTGGGVVYQDFGNLNWSIYVNKKSYNFLPPLVLYKHAAEVMCCVLKKFGVDARFAPPNRIEVDGYKVSGMAARAVANAVLVHGTLLFSTDLQKLNTLCITPPGCPPVMNLSVLNPEITIDRFIETFLQFLSEKGYVFRLDKAETFANQHPPGKKVFMHEDF